MSVPNTLYYIFNVGVFSFHHYVKEYKGIDIMKTYMSWTITEYAGFCLCEWHVQVYLGLHGICTIEQRCVM